MVTREPNSGFVMGTALGNVTTTEGYSPFAETSSLDSSVSGSSIYSAILNRDDGGRITSKTEILQGVSAAYVYAYDTAGRLANVTKNGSLAGHYTYDGNGNRLTGTTVAAPGTTVNGSYDAQDRIISYGSDTFTFGPNGNLQTKTTGASVTSFAYDNVGGLTSVQLPGSVRIDYFLDAAGRRVVRKKNGVFTNAWLYEGSRPVAELTASGTVSTRYIYTTKSNVPDFMFKGATLYRVISDERGSVRLVLNSSTGAVAQRLDYDAWGNVTANSSPGFQAFAFAGGIYDGETNLLRFGVRDYDPVLGRWLARDPTLFNGEDLNLFSYCRADPLNYFDQSGKNPLLIVAGAWGLGEAFVYAGVITAGV